MDKNRAISWALGIIVCLVLIIIIKGCMGEPDTSGLKKKSQTSAPADANTGISVFTGATTTAPPVLDIFGRPVENSDITDVAEETLPPATEEAVIETDVFGDIITTTAYVETDIFGDVVTTTSAGNAEVAESENIEVTTLSPLEQYEKDLKDPDSIGGFNHGQYDEEGNPVQTLAPDFAIIIN